MPVMHRRSESDGVLEIARDRYDVYVIRISITDQAGPRIAHSLKTMSANSVSFSTQRWRAYRFGYHWMPRAWSHSSGSSAQQTYIAKRTAVHTTATKP